MVDARRISITSDDRGPLVNVSAWIGIVTACIVVVVKVATKLVKVHMLQLDDYYIVAAAIIAISQSIATNVQVSAGLGKHWDALTEGQIVKLQKAVYASQILYVVVLSLTRLCVLAFFPFLVMTGRRRTITRVATLGTILWGSIVTLVLILQCSAPGTWAIFSNHCIEQSAFWTVEGIAGLLLDGFLALFPVYLVHDVQLPLRKKVFVMGAFAVRFVTMPFLILRLVLASRDTSSKHSSYDRFGETVAIVVHMNISIIASCIPFLKTFTDTLQTGLLSSDLHTLTPGGLSNSYKMKRMGQGYSGSGQSYPSQERRAWAENKNDTKWTADIQSHSMNHAQDSNRHSGGTSEEGLVIQQTMTTTVEIEDSGRS